MRIVAGELGGRTFDSPHTNATHPMSERVRGALFNILGDLSGLDVLDAFAGSGALAFEAISRGAASALLLEIDKDAQRTIRRNITLLTVDSRARLAKSGIDAWLRTSDPSTTFDIILCDPPYDNPQPQLLPKLAARLRPASLLVLSWPGKILPPLISGTTQVEHRQYGDIQLVFYRPIA